MPSNYKDIHWGIEKISKEKLNDMTANDRWLYEHMIKGYYDVNGISRETGLEIRVGYVKALVTEVGAVFVDHYFPKPFLPGVKPVIIGSLSSGSAFKVMTGTRGLDGRAIPDHRGFSVHWQQLRDPGGPSKFAGDQWMGYIAIAPSS